MRPPHTSRQSSDALQTPGSGVLLPGVVARVVKADGALAGYDEPGELVVKTPSVALGYANNLQACVHISTPASCNRSLICRAQDARDVYRRVRRSPFVRRNGYIRVFVCRWVKTGDEVRIRRDGEIIVMDRLKVPSRPRALSAPLNAQ